MASIAHQKTKDEYRCQLRYVTATVTSIIAELSKLRADFTWPDDVVQVIDVAPTNLK